MAAPATPASTVSSDGLFDRWYEHRDVRDRDALVERYLPLARKLALRYSGSSEPHEDLFQVASLGLLKAVERFDPTRGFQFTSFAVPTVVGELKRYFRDSSWALHVDRSAQELARRVIDAQREVAGREGRSPTIPELAQYLECTEEQVLDGLQTAEAFDTISLDAPRASEGEADSPLERIGGIDQRFGLVDVQATVFAAAQHLTVREREILYLRFSEDLTQAEIARRIGVSQMQVSRLLRRSVQRLRELTADRG